MFSPFISNPYIIVWRMRKQRKMDPIWTQSIIWATKMCQVSFPTLLTKLVARDQMLLLKSDGFLDLI